ncbi:MAG: lyase family protein, partial [Candidatus Sumerlaeia bacterium]|nr:lyase family protein [Candidatus Sumerlaeia bacterium]
SHSLLSYAQALERDLLRFHVAYSLINQSPLGAVAAYGTYWNIDRHYTAQLLGFERVQVNTIDCMSNRWEMEAEAAVAVAFLMNHLSIISEDLLLFSLPTLNLLVIDDQYVTGSSVMPQKRNLDFAEVTRAKASLIQSYAQALWGIGRGINSGYNRDEQWTKFIIIDVFDEAHYAPRLFRDIFATLRIDQSAMTRSTELGFLNALEVADFLSANYHLPFRLAYSIVAEAVRECSAEQRLMLDRVNRVLKNNKVNIQLTETDWQQVSDPQQIINNKKHLGGPAPIAIRENITYLRQQLAEHKNWLKQNNKSLDKAKRFLNQQIKELLKT